MATKTKPKPASKPVAKPKGGKPKATPKEVKGVIDPNKPRMVKISDIEVDLDTQIRVDMDEKVIQEYGDIFKESGDAQPFPAVALFQDGKKFYVGDGWHRINGAAYANREEVLANVQPGGKKAALLHALSANAGHGLRRTHADKRKAVGIVLNHPEWSEWSDREIANRCEVSHVFVGKLRKEREDEIERQAEPDEPETGNVSTPAVPKAGRTIVNGVEQDDPPHIAEMRESGLIAEGSVPTMVQAESGVSTTESLPDGGLSKDNAEFEWVDGLPLAKQLKGRPLQIFRDDAIGWQRMQAGRESVRLAKNAQYGNIKRDGEYLFRIEDFLKFPGPSEWVVCPPTDKGGCGGTGSTGLGQCSVCRGRGYSIDNRKFKSMERSNG